MSVVRLHDDPQPGDVGFWDDEMDHFTQFPLKQVSITLHTNDEGIGNWILVINEGRLVIHIEDIDVVRRIIASSQEATTKWADLLESAGVNATPKEVNGDLDEEMEFYLEGELIPRGTPVLFSQGRRTLEGVVIDFLPQGEDMVDALPEDTPFSRIKGQRRNHHSDRYIVGVQRTPSIVDFYSPTLDQTTTVNDEEDMQEYDEE